MKQYKLPLTVNEGRRKRATPKGNRMEKKKISPRIEGQSQEFLSKNFNTP